MADEEFDIYGDDALGEVKANGHEGPAPAASAVSAPPSAPSASFTPPAVVPPPPRVDRPIVESETMDGPNCLFVNELNWWTTDDDLRQIVVGQCRLPTQVLRDVTFDEHKVNGKSKGSAFLEFASPQAASTVATWFSNNEFQNKTCHVRLASGQQGNPFKTLPKPPPPREPRGRGRGGRGGGMMGGPPGGGGHGAVGGMGGPMGGAMPGMPGMPMMNPMMMMQMMQNMQGRGGMRGGMGGGAPAQGPGRGQFGGQGGYDNPHGAKRTRDDY